MGAGTSYAKLSKSEEERDLVGEDVWNVGKILGISGGYWQTCTLHTSVQLKLFSIIGEDHLSAIEVAGRLKAAPRGTKMLLNAVTAMGLLVKRDDLYSNTPASKAFLVENSPDYIGHIIKHHYHLVPAWSQLPQAVISGKPVRERFAFGEAEEREGFLIGMFNLAMQIAPKLSRELDLEGRQQLLDLGGGPGTYAIHFCLANPDLRATVYDLPTTEPFARQTIERFGLSDRIDFVPGDYVEADIKGSYDVAWLSHILHGEGPDDCQRILAKAVSTMEAGGLILIHDFILDDSLDGPLFPALFSLNMLVNTDLGQSYSEAEITRMLQGVGASQIRRLSFRGPNDSGVISGTV